MRPTSYPHEHLPTLDGWRGLAILWVLTAHLRLSLLRQGLLSEDSLLVRFGYHGETGVQIFFSVSGMLITFLLCRELAATGTLSLGRFYLKRVFRLLPASLCFLGFVAALHAAGQLEAGWKGIAAAVFLCRNYVASGDWYTGHFWSLSVEEHYYVLWPCVLIAISRRRAGLWLAVAILAAVLYREAVFTLELVDLSIEGVSKNARTDFLVVYLLGGSLFGYLLFRDESRELLGRLLPPSVAVLMIAVLAAGMWVDFHGVYLLKAMLFPAVMVSTVLHPGCPLSCLLEWRPLAGLGVISYGVYIWQQVWLSFDQESSAIGTLQAFPVNLVLAVLTGYLSYRIVETPIRRKGYVLVDKMFPPTGGDAPRRARGTR